MRNPNSLTSDRPCLVLVHRAINFSQIKKSRKSLLRYIPNVNESNVYQKFQARLRKVYQTLFIPKSVRDIPPEEFVKSIEDAKKQYQSLNLASLIQKILKDEPIDNAIKNLIPKPKSRIDLIAFNEVLVNQIRAKVDQGNLLGEFKIAEYFAEGAFYANNWRQKYFLNFADLESLNETNLQNFFYKLYEKYYHLPINPGELFAEDKVQIAKKVIAHRYIESLTQKSALEIYKSLGMLGGKSFWKFKLGLRYSPVWTNLQRLYRLRFTKFLELSLEAGFGAWLFNGFGIVQTPFVRNFLRYQTNKAHYLDVFEKGIHKSAFKNFNKETNRAMRDIRFAKLTRYTTTLAMITMVTSMYQFKNRERKHQESQYDGLSNKAGQAQRDYMEGDSSVEKRDDIIVSELINEFKESNNFFLINHIFQIYMESLKYEDLVKNKYSPMNLELYPERKSKVQELREDYRASLEILLNMEDDTKELKEKDQLLPLFIETEERLEELQNLPIYLND
ncbi:MAG: hypothetical protein ACPGJV_03795 [Bacteriovoracaceae bacterium]